MEDLADRVPVRQEEERGEKGVWGCLDPPRRWIEPGPGWNARAVGPGFGLPVCLSSLVWKL